MEKQDAEQELCVLSADFADLIKKIAQYVKNETKTELIASIGELSMSRLNNDVQVSSEPEKPVNDLYVCIFVFSN